MQTKCTSHLSTQRLLQWVTCMGSLIQCRVNGAMELLLQLSGIAVGCSCDCDRQTDRHLAVKVAACVLWLLRHRRLVDRSRRCTVVTLSYSYRKPISVCSVMFNQQMHKEFVNACLLLTALLHVLIPKYLLQGVVNMLQLICCSYQPVKMKSIIKIYM
jgi:hypothetical protein